MRRITMSIGKESPHRPGATGPASGRAVPSRLAMTDHPHPFNDGCATAVLNDMNDRDRPGRQI